jgi:hypothetical protein
VSFPAEGPDVGIEAKPLLPLNRLSKRVFFNTLQGLPAAASTAATAATGKSAATAGRGTGRGYR